MQVRASVRIVAAEDPLYDRAALLFSSMFSGISGVGYDTQTFEGGYGDGTDSGFDTAGNFEGDQGGYDQGGGDFDGGGSDFGGGFQLLSPAVRGNFVGPGAALC
ncbi:hypothetical protein ABIB34_003017 [Rhodococcus sp. UYP5]